MSASSQHLISSFCRTCLQQLTCESSYNLFASPGLAKKLSVCTSLSVKLQDGFPDNICGVCNTRLNEMHDFQEQCVDAVQKFQDMARLIGSNEVKAPSVFERSHNEQQDTDGIKNEIVISNNCEDINIDSQNLMNKKIKEDQVVLGGVEKIEIGETQMIQENFNKKGMKPQYSETTNTGAKKYECDRCEKKFTTFSNLKNHKNIHTGEKPHVCKTCGKQFSHRNYLRSHEMIHTEEKHHKCEICDKKFTRATGLKYHKNIHSGQKPHGCKTCGKKFSHPIHVKLHEAIHSGEKRHKCETCGKCFLRAWDLTLHKKAHTGEKPHTCKTCDKSYRWHHNLKCHEKTHITEDLCVCKTCGKEFSRRDYLNLHEKRHSIKKPFKCEICLKGFILSFELKRHKMTHTGESPFVCENCGKGFKRKYSLQTHQKKCMDVTCNETEANDNFKLKIEPIFPVSSDMDEQEFISISSK